MRKSGRPDLRATNQSPPRALYYAPQNPKAFELLPPDIAKLMPTHPDNEKVAHMVNYEWWADNTAQVQRRFEQWVQS